MSQTHHRGSILTGFPLSLPLIGTPGHLDGCRVGEMDAKTIRHVVEVYTIRGVCQARDHYLKEIPRLRFVHGRGSPRGVRPSHPVVFIGVRWPSRLSAAFGIGMPGAVAGACMVQIGRNGTDHLSLLSDDPRGPINPNHRCLPSVSAP